MDLMKDMYNSGDDKMKETIGKAMLESQKTEEKNQIYEHCGISIYKILKNKNVWCIFLCAT